MDNIIENEHIKYWIENRILFSEFINPIELNENNSKVIIELRHKISNNIKQYWCYDFRNVISMDRESRNYAEKYGQEFLHASAAIVKSRIQSFIINIFIGLKNPKIPFKAFIEKEDAIEWLNSIKKKKPL